MELKQSPAVKTTTNTAPKAPDGSLVSFRPETETFVYTSAEDGVQYEWDPVVRAWFPMFQEDLISRQQSAYKGTADSLDDMNRNSKNYRAPSTSISATTFPTASLNLHDDAGKKAPVNTKKRPAADTLPKPIKSIFISGLPPATTAEQLNQVFSRYGIIQEDVDTGAPRIKLYRHPPAEGGEGEGAFKGEALITYFKPESIDLAVQMMDESYFEPTHLIRVSRAVFDKAGKEEGDTSAGTKSGNEVKRGTEGQVSRRKYAKVMEKLNKKLGWDDEEPDAAPASKMVILKHMFTLKELEEDISLLVELPADVREECEKLGPVTSVIMYDLEEEGVMTVRFKSAEVAEKCVKRMDGRFFGGRKISAALSHSKIKFRRSSGKNAHEDEEDEQKRLAAYEAWLEGEH